MRVSEEREKYIKYYCTNISLSRGILLNSLKTIAEFKGEGGEYISCSFYPDDEDYVEGCVTLFF